MNAPSHDSSLRHGLSDAQWSVAGPLPNRLAKGPGRPSGGNRRFLHAVLWMAARRSAMERLARRIWALAGHSCPIPSLGAQGRLAPPVRGARRFGLGGFGFFRLRELESRAVRFRRPKARQKPPGKPKKGKPWAGAWAAWRPNSTPRVLLAGDCGPDSSRPGRRPTREWAPRCAVRSRRWRRRASARIALMTARKFARKLKKWGLRP